MAIIGISGTHHSGKTTVCDIINRELQKRNVDIYYAKEIARNLLKNKYRQIPTKMKDDVFMSFQNDILFEWVSIYDEMKGYENVITDRTPLDSLAYVLERETLPVGWVLNYVAKVIFIMEKFKYDLVAILSLIPMDFTNDTSWRDVRADYQDEINRIIRSLMSAYATVTNIAIVDYSDTDRKSFIEYVVNYFCIKESSNG